MQKAVFTIILMTIFCVSLPGQASVMKATALEEISTTAPKDTISVKLSRNFTLDSKTELKKGYILTGKMLDVKHPEQWHHNATFTFIPTSYKDLKGEEYPVTTEIKATYRQKMKPDYEHSEITVGDAMFSPSYIKDAERIKNGEAKEVWEDYSNRTTPWGKGDEIDIKSNETIYFNFPD